MGIYIGDKKYGLCMGKDNFIKTITLESSHESDSLGNPSYWANYLKLPLLSDSSDRNLYVVVFEGNHATNTSYRVDFAVYYRNNSSILCVSVRNNGTNSMHQYSTARSLWASTDTVIKVYKIPTVE